MNACMHVLWLYICVYRVLEPRRPSSEPLAHAHRPPHAIVTHHDRVVRDTHPNQSYKNTQAPSKHNSATRGLLELWSSTIVRISHFHNPLLLVVNPRLVAYLRTMGATGT
jgi:hypothetical protein